MMPDEFTEAVQALAATFRRMAEREDQIQTIIRSLTVPPVSEGGPWDGRKELKEQNQ